MNTEPATARNQRRAKNKTNTRVSQLAIEWQTAHDARTKIIEEQLLKEQRCPSPEERTLLNLVSHDVALAESLGEAEIQLAKRVLVLVDNAKVALTLAKTLKDVSVCRGAAERRIQDLLQTVGVLRGQRKLADVVPLRRVA